MRDLCWALAPENDLLAELAPYERFVPVAAPAAVAEWLRELDRNPAPIIAAVAGPKRLGFYFERLLLFYLRCGPHPHGELLDHNRVVYAIDNRQAKITVGELDFLLQQGDVNCHIEVAVKFYLGVASQGIPHWVGPHWQDRFDRKLCHLRDHQLPLSLGLERQSGKSFRRQFLLKGILFHPWPDLLRLSRDWLAAAQPAYWISLAEITAFPGAGKAIWWWLPKPRWLAGDARDLEVKALNWDAVPDILAAHFAQSRNVVMLRRAEDGQRLLVVPDDWLAGAVAAIS